LAQAIFAQVSWKNSESVLFVGSYIFFIVTMLAKGMTVSFGTLLIVWMIPSSLAVVLDDDYDIDSDDYYQNEAIGETDELASIESCPTADHPHLDKFIKTLGSNELKLWSKAARRDRLKAPKDFDKEWKSSYRNTTMDDKSDQLLEGSDASANLCHCCFKHPIVVKVGARMAQHMFPNLAEIIDNSIDNITETMKDHPDHTAEHMLKQMSKRSVALVAEDTVDSSDDYYSGEWFVPAVITNAVKSVKKAVTNFVSPGLKVVKSLKKPITCLVDVVGLVFDMIDLVVPVGGAINAGALSGTLKPSFLETFKGTQLPALQFISVAKKSGIGKAGGAWAGAKLVGGFINDIYGQTKEVFKEAIGQYTNTLPWWSVAVTVVKVTAQLAIWFLSGMVALIATIVLALVNLLSDLYKFFVEDKCISR